MPVTVPKGWGTNAAGPARFEGDFGAIAGQAGRGRLGAESTALKAGRGGRPCHIGEPWSG